VPDDTLRPRLAGPLDAPRVGVLLHEFNTEFEVPSPGADVLSARLSALLGTRDTFSVVAGDPAVAVALLTLRFNVWNDGPVALLDELYVVPDHRSDGIGAAVLAAVADELERRGAELIEVNVDEGDADALRFYERHGFSLADPDTHERALYLYRELTPAESTVTTRSAPDSFHGVFESLPRQGPGGREHTARALSACGDLVPRPDVIDLGCGSGAQTLDLAELTGGHVTAVDLHPPFAALLEGRAEARGVASQIDAITADMADPGLPAASADLVWSEGALYNIGLDAALPLARRLLRPGGYLVFTDAVWRRDDPPEPVREMFADAPTMGRVDDVLAALDRHGFDVLEHFPLPRTAWWDEFYVPMGRRVAELRLDPDADRAVLDEFDAEIDLFVQHSDCFGYEFFVARPRAVERA
jgi:SAM-dependent methyltransferase/GNAT superfamily N-acetyltransferase